MKISSSAAATWLLLQAGSAHAKCPFAGARELLSQAFVKDDAPVEPIEDARGRRLAFSNQRMGDGGVPEGGYEAVMADLEVLMTDSQAFFPADFEPPIGPNYGGLMIRLAWHCSGSYRESDGRGGCDGGRIRFDPEINWMDNASLEMALKLLEPIKEKYGSSLSWGDLVVLAGNAAIKVMGGPVLGFCGGRIDDPDGSESLRLGPSPEQEEIAPCITLGEDGRCKAPLGANVLGLIYVDPAGPEGNPDPALSALDVRDVFGRMGMNDTETVALIGGGHAFGKCHGPCMDPPCGRGTPLEGIGPNTFTSGFDGQWTTRPTTWSNDYFNNLFDIEWQLGQSPAGLPQWFPVDGPDIIMLTADLALANDPIYEPIARMFANDLGKLSEWFEFVWYKLVTSDMGPVDRCLGDMVPKAFPFQDPLPSAPATLPNFVPIRAAIQMVLNRDTSGTVGPELINLAYRCAATYRNTDYKGGCNGARIRFPPESEWEANAGTSETISTYLEPIKMRFRDVSYADLIVLAGITALEDLGYPAMPFCGGRVDAMEPADKPAALVPRTGNERISELAVLRDNWRVMGISEAMGIALAGREQAGVSFFRDLVANSDDSTMFSPEEQALASDVNLLHQIYVFIENPDIYYETFTSAWTYLMTADRFDGPTANACQGVDTPTVQSAGGGAKKKKKIVMNKRPGGRRPKRRRRRGRPSKRPGPKRRSINIP